MVIQWYPGHMTKARRMIEENIKLVDLVFELLDARIPLSSRNPDFERILATRPRIILLNKADMADPQATEAWVASYRKQGIDAVPIDALTGKGIRHALAIAKTVFAAKSQRLQARGIRNRAIRAMIVGIPNVGKSSFINKLVRKNTAKTGDRPGITKGKQWVKLQDGLELLDTPGVLWPKFEDQQQGMRLAATGAISDDVFDEYAVARYLITYLHRQYPAVLASRYELSALVEDADMMINEIGRKRGCLDPGGEINTLKAARIVLRELRSGKLGRLSLEWPQETEIQPAVD